VSGECHTSGTLMTTGNFPFTTNSQAQSIEQNAHKKVKHIYLTFDEGPLNGSRRINDAVLAEKLPIFVMLVKLHYSKYIFFSIFHH
jgi:hypothetical protein